MQYLGRVDGENGLKVYLAFSTGFFLDFFSFTGERSSVEFGGKAPVTFCPKFFPLSSGVSALVSVHLATPTAVLKLNPFHGRACPKFYGIRSARPLTATSVIKTEFFFPLSSDEKGTTSGAKAPANHLAPYASSSSSSSSSSSCHAIHLDYYNDLYIHFSVQQTWGYGVQIA